MKQDLLNEKSNFSEISKSICKIKKDKNNNATGFFLRTKYNKNHIYFLVTAHHEIPYTLVEPGDSKIEIITDFENIKQEITLNNEERKIICLKYEDITAIEILDTDIIRNKVKFLKYDKDCTENKRLSYLNIEMFIFHHPNGEKLQCNKGKILEIGNPKIYEFRHNLYTQKGSSGSPILFYKKSHKRPYPKPRVIGVHTSCDSETKTNIGTFIYSLTDIIKEGKHNFEYTHKLRVFEHKEYAFPSGTQVYAKIIKVDENSCLKMEPGTKLIIGADI